MKLYQAAATFTLFVLPACAVVTPIPPAEITTEPVELLWWPLASSLWIELIGPACDEVPMVGFADSELEISRWFSDVANLEDDHFEADVGDVLSRLEEPIDWNDEVVLLAVTKCESTSPVLSFTSVEPNSDYSELAVELSLFSPDTQNDMVGSLWTMAAIPRDWLGTLVVPSVDYESL